MMHLACPWCGYRNVSEFAYLGELLERPDPATTTPEEWRSYLYLRSNPAGRLEEGWYHRAGCRRYFEAVRDTTDNTVFETRRPTRGGEGTGGEEQPMPGEANAEGVTV
jgi:heterotetrameric sarcosine oxidase delta subunit